MSAGFTPGPWRVQGSEVVSENDPICSMPALYRSTAAAKAALAADAALIAAAPELYEALVIAHDRLADDAIFISAIDTALARARGDQ